VTYAVTIDVHAPAAVYQALHAQLLQRTGGQVDGLLVHLARPTGFACDFRPRLFISHDRTGGQRKLMFASADRTRMPVPCPASRPRPAEPAVAVRAPLPCPGLRARA
jgi:hypothetical protein